MYGSRRPIINYNSPPTKSFSKPVSIELDQTEVKRKYHKPEYKKKITYYYYKKPGYIAKEYRSKQKVKVSVIEKFFSEVSQIEFVQIEENKECLLRFNGKINRHPA